MFELAKLEIIMIFDAARIEYKCRALLGKITKDQGAKKDEKC